jgi:predicted O-linked N-acetylglucosamine transferase (SPINDLY family)
MIHCLQGSQRAELIERFAAHGVDAARIEFIGRRPLLEYLNLHWHVDIALDPFPFSGGTTTCDALWMGVPVVTLRGETAVSRGGASLLSAIGLQDWIAENPDQYIQIARKNSEDLPRLTLLRSSLRQRMQQSPLMDAGRFATAMESAFSTMWRSFLQGATASSAPC